MRSKGRSSTHLKRDFFVRHPLAVAFDLLGRTVTVDRDGGVVSGRIVEVEAYTGPEDPASHAAKYRTGVAALSSLPGTLYMYRSYGIHTMWNIVAHEPGAYGAVLIRAIEPVDGEAIMRERRGATVRKLASGPGSLCQALDLRLSDDRADMLAIDWLTLAPGHPCEAVLAGPRIGISTGLRAMWRLFDANSRHVSAHRRGDIVTHTMIAGLISMPGSSHA